MGFLNGVIKALGLDPNDRAVAKYEKKTQIIDSLEPEVEKLSDEELARSAEIFGARLEKGESLDDILPEVFARVREVSKLKFSARASKRARASTTYCPRFSRASARSRSVHSACATSRSSSSEAWRSTTATSPR